MHHKSNGSGSISVIELFKHMVNIIDGPYFFTPMVLQYTLYDVELPNSGKFPFFSTGISTGFDTRPSIFSRLSIS